MAMAHAGLFITDIVTLITTIMKESPPSHFISRVCMAASFLFIIVLMKIRKSPINLGPKSKLVSQIGLIQRLNGILLLLLPLNSSKF